MCGIFGYLGSEPTIQQLLNGIEKLEYRGYDSAGIAVTNNDTLCTVKSKGRIDDLKDKIDTTIHGTAGLAHTRWATHGEVTQTNAHPHTSGDIAIVHNGIIENHEELRHYLQQHGYEFTSDTDSEAIAHLLNHYLDESLEHAFQNALNDLQGSFAIAAVRNGKDKIVGTRRGNSLVFGTTDTGTYISSDEGSFANTADNVAYPGDDDIIQITPGGTTVLNTDDQPTYHVLDDDQAEITKDGHETYMHKEIHEQPRALRRTLNHDVDVDITQYNTIYLTACGTSLNACRIAQYLFEDTHNAKVNVEQASEFRYRNVPLTNDDLVIGISQSGETADTLGAVEQANGAGATTLGIVNEERSAIARQTDEYIGIKAGKEVGVASTKAFTAQLLTLHKIVGKDGLQQLPVKIQTVLDNEDTIAETARNYTDVDNALFLGRRINYPTALEGALKLKEISYIHAEGYSAAEMKHGPIALIDEHTPSVFTANTNQLYDKVRSNMEEVKARGGPVIAVSDDNVELADHVIPVPTAPPSLTPVLNTVALQLLAYHVASQNERDVDKPRNLAKCVTVE